MGAQGFHTYGFNRDWQNYVSREWIKAGYVTSSRKAAETRFLRIYKRPLGEFEEQIAKQNDGKGGCAICGRTMKGVRLNQDHDHRCCPRRFKEFCGKCNRGGLCFICNKFVAGIIERLKVDAQKLADYMTYWNAELPKRGAYEPKAEPKKGSKKKAKKTKVCSKQKSI